MFSSPNVEIAGESANPLSQLSKRELTRFVLERVAQARDLGGLSDAGHLREVEARNLTVLDVNTELVNYAGVADVDGQNDSVNINVLSVRHGSDVIVVLGIHSASQSEIVTQVGLVRAIEHEVVSYYSNQSKFLLYLIPVTESKLLHPKGQSFYTELPL